MILNKKKIYLILIIWVVLFGILIRFGLLFFIREFEKTSQGLAFQKRALQFFQLRIEDFENFQKNYSLYQPVFEKIDSSFVNREVPIEFIKFLEEEAKSSDLLIEISPLGIKPTKTDPWIPVGFQVSLEGPFSNCLRFLERLEQSSFFVEINQLDVRRIEEKKARLKESEGLKTGDVSFILKFKAFSEEVS